MSETAEKLPQKQRDPIMDLLAKYKMAIQSVLPKHLTPERILRIAYQAIRKTPKLRECSQVSLINSVIEASMRGLEIGYGAHLVPYKSDCVLICDYKGYIDLAHRSGQIDSFPLKPVYAKDEFDYEEGTTRYIKHKPYRGTDGRGDLIAAYAVVFFKHGGYDFEVVLPADIEATKRVSPGAKSPDSPWNKVDQEWTMWCKTAARRIAKRVPQSPELQRVAQLEELAEAGLRQQIAHIDAPVDVTFSDVDAKTDQRVQDLKSRLKDKGTPKTDKEWSIDKDHPWHPDKWLKKKEKGFSTYYFKHEKEFEDVKNNHPDVLKRFNQKWADVYPGEMRPWETEPPETNEPPPQGQSDPGTGSGENGGYGLNLQEQQERVNIIKNIKEYSEDQFKQAAMVLHMATGTMPHTLDNCIALLDKLKEMFGEKF